MKPIVFQKRVEIPGGLWSDKLGGAFQEGDPAKTSFYVEGRCEVKERAGRLRLFFQDVKLVKRRVVISDAEKEAFVKLYRTERGIVDGVDDDEPEEERLKQQQEFAAAYDDYVKVQQAKELEVPRLFIYMSKKPPKKRMIDVHRVGSKVLLNGDDEGMFGRERTLGSFEASLKDIVDAIEYLGVVVVKLPHDKPVTEEPVVYGFVKLQSSRFNRVKTLNALNLTEISETLAKVANQRQQDDDGTGPGKQQLRVAEVLKPLNVYSSIASRAWVAFQRDQGEEIDFSLFLKMLDYSEVFLVDAQARRLFDAVDLRGEGKITISEFENFLMAYDVLGQASTDLLLLDIYDTLKFQPHVQFGEFGNHDGMDYLGFQESMQMLGVIAAEEDMQRHFCQAGGAKPKDIDNVYLSWTQFKKAWGNLIDVDKEIEARKIKVDRGLLGIGRNKDKLVQVLEEKEKTYFDNLNAINEIIEGIKADRRHRKEEKRHEHADFKTKLQRDANKFIAVRMQEKRLRHKQEQEDRRTKRAEEKLLRRKLLQQQEEAREAKRLEIAEATRAAEELRQSNIRARGLDLLDLSSQGLREVPLSLYATPEAKTKLTYLVMVDMSNNIIDALPDTNFLYWMADVRKFKLSSNRLRTLPDQLRQMVAVELFELDCNRLEALPPAIGQLTALKRFNVSKNLLVEFPPEFGSCFALKHISAHSNRLARLPNSMGNMSALEYLDLSGNALTELPEDFQYLMSLVHLNVSGNRLGHLPPKIGSCKNLLRLDLTDNNLAYLPQTFSELCNLEICNADNNQIILAPNRLNTLTALKQLNLKRNKTTSLYADIRNCVSLEILDLSSNHLEHLPPEIGLTTSLQELRLQYNQLTMPKLHACPELASCFSMQVLDLSHNALDGPLPDAIGLIRMLNRLNISFNGVTSIPKSIVGLQELVYLDAERCSLTEFPDTFFHLKKLETLIVSNNRFTKFPQGVGDMVALKSLDLSDNGIFILPKKVCTLTSLDYLNLSKNKLRALPLEFADVLESVERVVMHGNPWTDLPKKWGRVWAGQKTVDGYDGYNLADAIDYLYGIRVFFNTAEEMWHEKGPMYLAGKLGFNDFLLDLKSRIPYSWSDSYQECVKHVFFSAREAGVFPQWHEIEDEAAAKEMDMLRRVNAAERDAMLVRVKREEDVLEAIKVAAYDTDRTNRVRIGEKLAHQMHKASVYDRTAEDHVSSASGMSENERKLVKRIENKRRKNLARHEKLKELERNRLNAIVEADNAATMDVSFPSPHRK